jgi:hypothetical protein
MKDQQKAYKKAVHNWFNDGINEMVMAGMCLLLAAYFIAIELISQNSFLDTFLEASMILVILGGTFGLNKLATYLKERFTYPRSGYIVFKTNKLLPRWVVALLGMLISAVLAGIVAVIIAHINDSRRWIPAISGIILSLSFFIVAIRINTVRIMFESILALALGFLISWFRIGYNIGLGLFYAVLGISILIIAGVVFWLYLRHNPLPVEDLHER